MKTFTRIKDFVSDLFRANEQVPLLIASLLVFFSYDVISWATNGQGATYTIPLAQAILFAALIVLSAIIFVRWVIKWQWKSLDMYLKNLFDTHVFDTAGSSEKNPLIVLTVGFTLMLVYIFCNVVVALIS